MNDRKHAQIDLILLRATKYASDMLDEQIKTIHAKHAACGICWTRTDNSFRPFLTTFGRQTWPTQE